MAYVQVPYANLSAVREYRKLEPDSTADDILLLRLTQRASRIADMIARRRFYPWRELRKYDYPQKNYATLEMGYWVGNQYYSMGGTVLEVDEDLLEVELLQTRGGLTTVAAQDFWLLTRDRRYKPPPYELIKLRPNGATPVFLINDRYEEANWVTGVWGYHVYWSELAWEDSQDAVAVALTTTAGTVEVTDADGADLYGSAPRFEAGQLLKVDTEYVYVKTVNVAGTANNLTVLRGVNGTVAATHSTNAVLNTFRPMPEIVQACTRLAAWLYQQRETAGDALADAQVTPQGNVMIPPRLPKDIYDQIASYRKL